MLDLIERRKLLINDISLASVTDEYMAEVAKRQEMSLPGTANFVALAATLLLIKSKSLLPTLDLSSEEEESIEDLEERLKLYQIYREAAKVVEVSFGVRMIQSRLQSNNKKIVFKPDEYCKTDIFKTAIESVIQALPVKETRKEVRVKPAISLEEMVEKLHERIQKQMKLRLSELVADDGEKTTMIVGFLAILESVKQGSVLVAQTAKFEDIEVESVGAKVPRY